VIHHGDCLEVMAGLEPRQSVDAVVTDPPYGLEFMGMAWDQPRRPTERHAASPNVSGATSAAASTPEASMTSNE
jgi:DNA modification methylase